MATQPEALNALLTPLLTAINRELTMIKCELSVELNNLSQKIDALAALTAPRGAKSTKAKADDAEPAAAAGVATPAAAADPAVHADVKTPGNKRNWFLGNAKIRGAAFLVEYSSQTIVETATADPSNLTKKTEQSRANNIATIVYDTLKANPTGALMKRVDTEFEALKAANAKAPATGDTRVVFEPHTAAAQ